MEQFSSRKNFRLEPALMERARRDFSARRGGDDETLETMKACFDATGMTIDPHTAVGLYAAMAGMEADPAIPMVALACAHPAKFPEAVEKATGHRPPVPARLAAVMKKAEHLMVLPKELEKLKLVMRQDVQK
jgi:threonine synthase